ncbi:hypothetical protein N658DRAFT_507479 [Parathielavia hyrcaniae]|uniref:Uncharacterized protein n=1 Tax=Parathielavia hyrcaniae TaxID=113614 RepID=A0AAN6PZG5_9PEZI|nr:hypothetical protein N658DRAFT_507479 [Parathielavia hyrcaniae]
MALLPTDALDPQWFLREDDGLECLGDEANGYSHPWDAPGPESPDSAGGRLDQLALPWDNCVDRQDLMLSGAFLPYAPETGFGGQHTPWNLDPASVSPGAVLDATFHGGPELDNAAVPSSLGFSGVFPDTAPHYPVGASMLDASVFLVAFPQVSHASDKKHQNNHTRPWKCPYCTTFPGGANRKDLNRHLRRFHPLEPQVRDNKAHWKEVVRCAGCGREMRADNLKRHIKKCDKLVGGRGRGASGAGEVELELCI